MGSSDKNVLPILYESNGSYCTVADVQSETSAYRFDGIDGARMCN